MNYESLVFENKSYGRGRFARYTFDNGYTVSVITDGYGGERGLLELAILHNDELCYDTPITDDVIGHLTPNDVTIIMRKVAALPVREKAA